ncbi:MAG: hypothetical protein AMJ95_07395 [Omnitrophica WOR_2 bacterium SM23_72]|nr:MAG: hypothetical protein AMJ95_07395 [Omnitrophica WOR_2 bacterium SM23_72]
MTDLDQNRLIEMVLTFVLMFLATALFGEASLDPYRLLLIAGLIGGFSFAWFMREKEQPATKYFLTIGAFSVLVWFIVSVANSTFLYRDVILICIKGLIFVEVILSFDIHLLPYMQLLCIPLYMCFPFFFRGQMESLLILIVFFSILDWFILLKMQLYNFLKVPLKRVWSRRYISILSLAALLLLSLSLGWILYYGLRLDSMKKGGLFLVEEIDLKGTSSQTEQTLFDLQDKLIKEMSEEIAEKPALQDKYSMMNLLDVIVKKTEDAKQVKKAATGLVSHLKMEGPGIKLKAERPTLATLKEYVNSVIRHQLNKTEQEMRQNLQKTPLDIKRSMATSALVRKMNKSSTTEQVAKYEKELQKTIQNARANTKLKEERMKLVRKMREWKSFELSKWDQVAVPLQKVPPPPEPLTPEQKELIAKAEALKTTPPPQPLTPEQKELIAKAEALKTTPPPQPLTPEQQELTAQAEALKEMVTPEPLTPEQQLAMQKELEEKLELQPKNLEEEFRRSRRVLGIKVKEQRLILILRLIWKLYILLLLLLLILIVLFIWFLVLYFRTQKRKREIMALYYSRPNEFIIHLDENIKGVLAIFGLPYKKNTPPLHYADFVEEKCLIENKIFKRFAIKFEEAKYSRHMLKSEDALTALYGYNGLLKTLFSGCSKSVLAVRYILGLMQVRPFLMPDRPEAI